MRRIFTILGPVGVTLALPAAAMAQAATFAGGIFQESICDLIGLMGGSLGAMLTSAAIVTALVGAAVGGFGNFRSAVMVGASSFGFAAGISVYFGNFNC